MPLCGLRKSVAGFLPYPHTSSYLQRLKQVNYATFTGNHVTRLHPSVFTFGITKEQFKPAFL